MPQKYYLDTQILLVIITNGDKIHGNNKPPMTQHSLNLTPYAPTYYLDTPYQPSIIQQPLPLILYPHALMLLKFFLSSSAQAYF